MPSLSITLLSVIAAVMLICLWCCVLERRWGVFAFALVMFSAILGVLIYGLG